MEDFYKWNKYIMYQNGYWPFPDSRKIEAMKLINGYFNVVLGFLVGAVETWEGVDNLNNIARFMEIACVVPTALITVLKITLFLKNRNFMRTFLNAQKDLLENPPIPATDETIVKIINQWKQRAYKLCKTLLCVYTQPFVFYMSMPWWKYYTSGVLEHPFPSKFPMDTSTFEVQLICYLMEFIMAYFLIFTFMSAESLFGASILCVCSSIDILNHSMNMATTEAIEQGKRTPLFGITVEYHKKLLKVCTMIEKLYSPSLLIQFFFSMVTLCMLCFLTTQKLELGKQLTFFTYFITMSTQLFVYCYLGQLLQTKFEELCNNGFHSNWSDASVEYQKHIQFYLLRCMKPVILTAYKIMPVNLESYFAICKSSLSYLTMLQSMDE